MGKSGGSGGLGGKGIRAALGYLGPTTMARKQLFRQMASALTTGGRGAKIPFIQQAMARSTAAGKQALAGASASLSGLDVARTRGDETANIRGRIINRISQMQRQGTAGIAPRVAQQFISAAPSFISGQGGAAAGGMGIASAGMEAAQRAASIRAQGFANLASSLAGAAGGVAGAYGGGGPAPLPSAAAPGAAPYSIAAPGAPYAAGTRPSWFDRFRG